MYSFPIPLRNKLTNTHAGPSLCSDGSGDIEQFSPGVFSVFHKLTLTSLYTS